MGMFDEISCERELPDGTHGKGRAFQTKDTPAQFLEHYTITEDGRLVHHQVRYEIVPEEERYHYGTPKWNSFPMSRLRGMMRKIPLEDADMEYHGDINFYDSQGDYVARFTNGRLQGIQQGERWVNEGGG